MMRYIRGHPPCDEVQEDHDLAHDPNHPEAALPQTGSQAHKLIHRLMLGLGLVLRHKLGLGLMLELGLSLGDGVRPRVQAEG